MCTKQQESEGPQHCCLLEMYYMQSSVDYEYKRNPISLMKHTYKNISEEMLTVGTFEMLYWFNVYLVGFF